MLSPNLSIHSRLLSGKGWTFIGSYGTKFPGNSYALVSPKDDRDFNDFVTLTLTSQTSIRSWDERLLYNTSLETQQCLKAVGESIASHHG